MLSLAAFERCLLQGRWGGVPVATPRTSASQSCHVGRWRRNLYSFVPSPQPRATVLLIAVCPQTPCSSALFVCVSSGLVSSWTSWAFVSVWELTSLGFSLRVASRFRPQFVCGKHKVFFVVVIALTSLFHFTSMLICLIKRETFGYSFIVPCYFFFFFAFCCKPLIIPRLCWWSVTSPF